MYQCLTLDRHTFNLKCMCYVVLKHFNSRKLTWFFFFFFLNLQKYRLYLKGISSGENQQANTSHSRFSSLTRVGGHFHTLNNPRQFHNHNSAFRPFPASVNMHGFPTHNLNHSAKITLSFNRPKLMPIRTMFKECQFLL